MSVPPGTGGGVVQAGYKEGRTGVPCPGIAMKIVDPDTGAELGPNEPGLLYLRGPNVMLGYLGRQDLTDEVIDKDGWYCTGDIAFVDEDGFVALTDRLSRFSKIGGEMVPHQGVEEAIVSAAATRRGSRRHSTAWTEFRTSGSPLPRTTTAWTRFRCSGPARSTSGRSRSSRGRSTRPRGKPRRCVDARAGMW